MIAASIGFALLVTGCSSGEESLQSPDGRLSLTTGLKDGRAWYTLKRDGKTIASSSSLGFKLQDGSLKEGLKLNAARHDSFDETWVQPWGEEIEVRNHYNELTLELQEAEGKQRKMDIVFRLFNDGLGFRYNFPEQENLKEFVIMDEETEYTFPTDARSWSIPTNTTYYEALFTPEPLSQKDTVSTPVTMEVADDLYLVLHEANLTDYACMNLTPVQKENAPEGSVTVRTALTPWSTGEKVFASAPFATPWRTIIVADKPGDLILSRLMLNLNEPCRIEDTSWIEPGRYIGIWWAIHMNNYTWCQGPKHGATTENTMRYIDFAAKHNFSGVLVEGWNYGWDGDWSLYGHLFDFCKPYPDYDLEKLAEYARQKGVRLIAHNETGGAARNYEQQLDSAFALYQRLGINSVKTGYVNALMDHKELQHSQYGVRHYRKVIETAAKYGIMIDNHEPAMPTGLQRTYPNLMTQEGVRGQEWNAWSTDGGNPPEHTCTLPFTRGLAGPMDFTPGIFNFSNPVLPETHPHTTLAKQLALYVVLFSPLQMAADMIENYENQPAFSFITSCPTTWAKTVVPNAKIGEYVTIARRDRHSSNWFIGSITDAEPRTIEVSLDFLEPGASYKATFYEDGEGADYRTNPYPVKITEKEVNSDTTLTLQLAPGGGAAVRIEKI
ncbi:MAG: glycoside hydrolase family 97 protein [Bacteroides sp.]|nr:glycoside hydrolase family 97 protein [Bacteroides sp.]